MDEVVESLSDESLESLESPSPAIRAETECRTPDGGSPSGSPRRSINPTSIIPTPIRNSIARVQPKEHDPNFDHVKADAAGLLYHVYKPVGPFSVELPFAEVKSLICVSEAGPSWQTSAAAAERSNILRKWIASEIPSHLALTFDQPILLKFLAPSGGKKKSRGRPRQHPFVIGYKGYCSARRDGCPTTFSVGFTKESLQKLLQPSVTETIELSIEVNDACVHVKGQQYGQVRGVARQLVIDQYNKAEKKPSEFSKTSLATATDNEFHSLNNSNIVTRGVAYNISREAKEKKRKSLGLTQCKLANVMIARSIMDKQDLKARDAIGDSSADVLGIIQSVELCPDFRMCMWTKTSVQLFQHLAKTGMLILNVDATGGLLDFPMVEELKEKILHTKMAVSPKYALVASEDMRDKTVSRMLSPLTIAEMVSNRNRGYDIHKFYQDFLKNVITPTNEKAVMPLLCLTD
jgi:hypothetical protein